MSNDISDVIVGHLTDIADSIRTKSSTSEDIKLQEMSAKILAIPSGPAPTGKKLIADLNEADVSAYATAQVSDANIVPENIKKDVTILGVTGTHEGGSGIQPQLHSPTALSYSQKALTWQVDSYAESSKLYLDDVLIATLAVPTTSYDATTELTAASTGSHVFKVSTSASLFQDSAKVSKSVAKRSISVTVTDGTFSGPSFMMQDEEVEIVIAPTDPVAQVIINSVTNCEWAFFDGTLTLTNPTGDVVIDAICETSPYCIIGVKGLSSETSTLERTNLGKNISIVKLSSGNDTAYGIEGFDLDKVWAKYYDDDGLPVIYGTDELYMWHHPNETTRVTGNIFSRIKRFFVKPTYVDDKLEQIQLCFSDEKPDNTWQDWFNGKEYVDIGAFIAEFETVGSYKKPISADHTASSPTNRKTNVGSKLEIATALEGVKQYSSQDYDYHLQWFNEHAILRVLFMVLFAERDLSKFDVAETRLNNAIDLYDSVVFRSSDDSYRVLYFGERYMSQAYYGANMFLGIVGAFMRKFSIYGVKIDPSDKSIYATYDYASFDYSATLPQADLSLTAENGYFTEMRCSETFPGLMLPSATNNDSAYHDKYYCMYWSRNGYVAFVLSAKAYDLHAYYHVLNLATASPTLDSTYYHRLCRTPKS